jgi:hypothetical protein
MADVFEGAEPNAYRAAITSVVANAPRDEWTKCVQYPVHLFSRGQREVKQFDCPAQQPEPNTVIITRCGSDVWSVLRHRKR